MLMKSKRSEWVESGESWSYFLVSCLSSATPFHIPSMSACQALFICSLHFLIHGCISHCNKDRRGNKCAQPCTNEDLIWPAFCHGTLEFYLNGYHLDSDIEAAFLPRSTNISNIIANIEHCNVHSSARTRLVLDWLWISVILYRSVQWFATSWIASLGTNLKVIVVMIWILKNRTLLTRQALAYCCSVIGDLFTHPCKSQLYVFG